MEESSNKILAAEKSLQEERQRCVILEQQLEKLQMDAGSDTSEQKSPMRSKTGKVEHLSLILPLRLIATTFGHSSVKPTQVLDLTHGDLDLLRPVEKYRM